MKNGISETDQSEFHIQGLVVGNGKCHTTVWAETHTYKKPASAGFFMPCTK
jgi:hypothetical protein